MAALVPGQILGGKWGALYTLRDAIITLQNGKVVSTTEADTGRKWLAGATVYSKALAVAAGPNMNTINVAHGVTGLAAVVSVYGSLRNGSNDRIVFPSDGASLSLNIDQTNVELTSAADLSGYVGTIVIEYTKA